MSLMELFSGNPGNPNKKTGVTATGHTTQGGNLGNPGNPRKQTFKVKLMKPSTDAKPTGTRLVIFYRGRYDDLSL